MTIPFLQVRPKSIKLKVSPRFPAQLLDGIGTAVQKQNGNYSINFDYTNFNQLGALPVNPNLYVLGWDSQLNQFNLVPPAGGLTEAPLDANTYGRHGGGWTPVLTIAGGTVTGPVTFSSGAIFTQPINMNFAFGSIELGTNASVSTPFLDFHSSGSVRDYDARIIASGGSTSADGQGTLNLLCAVATGPTPAVNDNSASFATTAFVRNQVPVTLTGTSGSWGTGNATIVNASGTFTLTLPTASANSGRSLILKSLTAQIVNSASSNVCPISSATAGTAIFTATAGKWATLISDGTNWIVMAGN